MHHTNIEIAPVSNLASARKIVGVKPGFCKWIKRRANKKARRIHKEDLLGFGEDYDERPLRPCTDWDLS